MDSPESRKAYEEYYHPISRAKGDAVAREFLDRISAVGQYPSFLDRKDSPFVVADFGTGTGGLAEGILPVVLGSLPAETPVELWLYDKSEEALRIAPQNIRKTLTGLAVRIHPVRCTFPGSVRLPDTLHFLIQGNLLAEMDDGAADQIYRPLGESLRRMAPGGALIWVEPADRISSRRLLSLRDRMIKLYPEFIVLAPCPNLRNASCPALKTDKDWCHEDRPYAFSEDVRRLAKTVGHIKDSLKMTYIIAMKRHDDFPFRTSTMPVWRLVSELREETGLAWGIFCDGAERRRIRILKRYKNEGNKTFWKLGRGDTILPPPEDQMNARSGFWDLSPQAEIRLVPGSSENGAGSAMPEQGQDRPWT